MLPQQLTRAQASSVRSIPARRSFLEEPVDRASGDAQFACYRRGPQTAIRKRLDALAVKAGLATRVDTLALGHRDALELALAADIGLEGGKDGQHAIEGASRSCRGIDALLDDFEVGPGLFYLVSDIGEVPHRAPQPVQPRHDKRVSLAQNRKDLLQLGATLALRAARLLFEDDAHARQVQCVPLHGEVLVRCR